MATPENIFPNKLATQYLSGKVLNRDTTHQREQLTVIIQQFQQTVVRLQKKKPGADESPAT